MAFGSPAHLVVLAATALLALGLGLAARRGPGAPWHAPARRALAALLVLNEVVFHVVLVAEGDFSTRSDLPLHLTDAATVAAAVALWSAHPLAVELTYFWGLTASVQALLTPDLRPGVIDYRWVWFVVSHAGVVVAAILLVWGLRRTPRAGAVGRVYLWSLAVAVAAAVGNWTTGGNYMFLRRPPSEPSLLDHMGPWPWYIASAAVLALVLFRLLDQPLRGRPERRGRREVI